MARNDDLNNLNEGLRRLQEYEQTLKRIESLAKSIATLLNSSGDKSGLMGNLQQLQTLRVEASTGGVTGGSAYAGMGFGATNGMPLANAGAGVVSDALMTQLDRSRARQQQNAFNPFAGGGAVGPSSTIGTPGYGYNAWYFQQQSARQNWAGQQTAMARSAIGLGASHFISGGLNLYAQNTASGEYDPMTAAGLHGGLAGALVGSAAGLVASIRTEPGLGFSLGAIMGQQVGSAGAQAAMAPYMQTRRAALSLSSFAARSNLSPYDFILPDRGAGRSLEEISEDVSFTGKSLKDKALLKAGLYTGTDIISVSKLAETVSTLGSAYLASGENPRGLVSETAGRLAKQYGLATPEIARMAAPALAARNRYADNNADLLLNFGAEGYGAYQDVIGGKQLSPRELTAVANIQRQQGRIEMASLQTRGAASATLQQVNTQLNEIARLPDGRSSLAFAQGSAQARELGFEAFQTEQIGRFALPMTELSGRMARANLMPFGSGNQLSMQFENIGLQRQRIGDLESFRRRRRASGQLSEQEELSLSQQIEESRNSIAGSIGMLGEGRENLLPGLTAGATRYSGRFTSTSLAALSLAGSGSPIRSYGAVNGRHLAQQDSLWQEMGGAGFERPSSRSMALNNGRDSAEIVSAIKELTRTMERLMGDNGGGYARSGEGAARTQGALSRANLGGDAFANGAN